MANKRTDKVNKSPKTKSFLLTLGLVLIVGYFVITIIGLQLDIKERRTELNEKKSEYQQLVNENDRLQSVVDNEDKSSYIEQIAREKLGFVMPGEKVFYDVTPGV